MDLALLSSVSEVLVGPSRPDESMFTTAFKDSVPIIQSAAEAMRGLGPTMVTVAG